ncbi:MAG TPA: clostripain-related cysteine peptidase, partial [Thermoanaerobaculia bacterium]|nr:clostripain-related cysteine peptidase [Thermoanaerobaculia bacterium]
MAFKLRVKCHGIMAGVESLEGDQFTLLLIKGDRAIIPDQVSYVRFPEASYPASNTRRPEGQLRPDGLRHIVLRNERLTIVTDPAGPHKVLSLKRDTDPRPSSTPTRTNATSLRWVPTVQELVPGNGDLNPDFFNSPLAADPPLIARVDFAQGVLGTTGADPVQVPFVNKAGTTKLPIARELLLELDVESDNFVLQSLNLDGSPNPDRHMRFEPGGDVEIVIGNESAADIYEPSEPLRDLDVIAGRCMAEFTIYYGMCANTPVDPPMPFISARPGVQTCCSVCIFNPSGLLKHEVESAPMREAAVMAPPWSVFAFIAADNTLSKAAEVDLKEMELLDPASIGLVVQIDRPSRDAERLALGTRGFEPLSDEALGDINFGKAAALTEFLVAAKRVRPAKNMAVMLPTHSLGLLDFVYKKLLEHHETDRSVVKAMLRSAGLVNFEVVLEESLKLVKAIGPDDSSRDFLNNRELATGLRDALGNDGPFAILGFDACMMGLVEMAFQLRDCGQYFVASQEDIRAEGWKYDVALKALAAAYGPREGAIAIVDAYAAATAGDPFATLSAVDLTQMNALAASLDGLGALLLKLIPGEMDALARARESARAFATFHYIDLFGFVSALEPELQKTAIPRGELAAIAGLADQVRKLIAAAVIRTNNKAAQSRAHGLSV